MSDDIQSRLGFMNFAPEQRDLLKTGGLIGRLIPRALDRFYDKVRATPETAAFFRDSSQMHKAQSAQEKHWTRIASGQFDGQFAEGVRRIGTVHATIGLEPRWYIGAYALVLEQVLLGLGREYSLGKRIRNWFRGPSQAELSVALIKAALLDMELSISIYFERSQVQRNKAIEALSAALKTLAAGNLTSSLGEMPADFQAIKRDYDQAVTNLAGLISDVSGGTTQIQTGSAEIAQAAEDLARRTETTAATLEQTSAAVVQMDATLKATSASAERTVKQAEGAGETVARGRAVAGSAVQAMETVSRSATGIDDVIEGLDKIAFQTRVLAMNAAVEAGRAGEAGRGFAVVADLVSALAMRAEEEAKRARSQLTTTQAEIGMAVQAVENVDAELGKISTDVDAVHQLLNAIAKDNVAQAAAITEIRVAIGSMDVATQQNAAMVEETSAAARNLATEVAKLNEKTSHFDTGELANEPAALRQRIASRMGELRSAA